MVDNTCPIIDSTIGCNTVSNISIVPNSVDIADKKPDWIFIIGIIIVIVLGYLLIKH